MTVTSKSRRVTVKGPRGEIKKDISHIAVDIKMVEKDGKRTLVFQRWLSTYKQKSVVKTASSLIRNMVVGVTKVRIRTPRAN